MGVGGPGGREGPKQSNPLIPPSPSLSLEPPLPSPLRRPASNSGLKIDPTLKSATPSVPRPKFLTLSTQPRILKNLLVWPLALASPPPHALAPKKKIQLLRARTESFACRLEQSQDQDPAAYSKSQTRCLVCRTTWMTAHLI